MAVSLQKGQKIDLTKGRAGLNKLVVGLGWDQVAGQPKEKKGLFGRHGGKGKEIDCDALAILCDGNNRMIGHDDRVFFANKQHDSGAVEHLGDNLTGAGEGDDEQMVVNLSAVPPTYDKIVFAVTIYQARKREQHFGGIKNAYIRIVNADTQEELCRYNLSEHYDQMTAMLFGEVYRHQGEWKFNALGQGTTDDGVDELAARFS